MSASTFLTRRQGRSTSSPRLSSCRRRTSLLASLLAVLLYSSYAFVPSFSQHYKTRNTFSTTTRKVSHATERRSVDSMARSAISLPDTVSSRLDDNDDDGFVMANLDSAVPPRTSLSGQSPSSSSLSASSSSSSSFDTAEGPDQEPSSSSLSSRHRIDLEADGTLRIRSKVDNDDNEDDSTKETILLNGLMPPGLWSSSRPISKSTDALFLHTQYDRELSEHQSQLGALTTCHRLLACSRLTRYWMGPKVGTSAKDVPFDTQFLLIELQEGGPYALMLPLVDNGFRASLHYGKAGSIDVVCYAESGDAAVTSSGMRALYVTVGDDPYQVIQQGFADVAEATQTFTTLDNKVLPPTVDEFGWCTWDAFYSDVTPAGVIQGVESLRNAGVPPKTLILDDGWQQVTPDPPGEEEIAVEQDIDAEEVRTTSLVTEAVQQQDDAPFYVRAVTGFYENYVRKAPHGSFGNKIWSKLSRTILKPRLWDFFDSETDFNRQLGDFRPNIKFNNDKEQVTLKDLVSKLKNELGMKHVYCWHALHGYWRGVSEDLGRREGLNVTNIIPQTSSSLLRLEPQMSWDPVSLWGVGLMTNEEDLDKFYAKLHAPLVEAGIDGVKVDVQSGVSAAGGGVGGGPHLAELYTNAMEKSVSKNFFDPDTGAKNCINCMCHSTENLYRYKETAVARASDDFYPTRTESHTVHLVNVAYNSLFIGEICLPDWDMFHSKHESAGLHAAARAVGGCPVYVSDKPGKHDVELLRKLVLPDGSILRATLPGRPTRDCLFVDVGTDGQSALKVWNQNAYGGVIGAMNVQGVAWNFDTRENDVLNENPAPVEARATPHDIETLRNHKGPFAVWKHQEQRVEFIPDGSTTIRAKPLAHRDWEIYTVAPIQIAETNNPIKPAIMWSPIGLAEMLNSGGAIINADDHLMTPSGAASISGPFGDISIGKTIARFTSRGPGRFVAFTNRRPSTVMLSSGRKLSYTFDQDHCELMISLPKEDSNGDGKLVPHEVVVLWDN